jgi:hypothetical protein
VVLSFAPLDEASDQSGDVAEVGVGEAAGERRKELLALGR